MMAGEGELPSIGMFLYDPKGNAIVPLFTSVGS